MEFLYEYGLFLAKTITFVAAIVIILVAVAQTKKSQKGKKGELELTNLSEKFKEMKDGLEAHLFSKEQLKQKEKAQKEADKAAKKQAKAKAKNKSTDANEQLGEQDKKRLFVIEFKSGIDAQEVDNLREEVTAVLAVATENDEVLIKLESGGGVVHGYGLAASQLARLKQKGVPLTISIDKVAASGGYMMACVADKIIAAPFAIVGSIGVIAQLPNFNKVLKKHDIDFEQITAGEFKRTLTMFGENTDKAREKFKAELEEIHKLFVEHIGSFRPELEVEKVATGEHWMASKAQALGLVDELQTSDDYVVEQIDSADVYQVKYAVAKNVLEKLPFAASATIEKVFLGLADKLRNIRFS
ncbi:inner membrane peptidase [Catenovulum agarivorans DS-2]|uniref:Inner membrane peptidase n=1 Tax=Catenovulum agarivorans DS-2 TaxID=1328313 RepID=W7QKC6_9ALTE|nr:protease SohB [Catenovulum agarivorans]EWH12376.1 inner membrane peptidase [Catenovulum agarivorans DS-2]